MAAQVANKADTGSRCPRCHQPIPADAPRGLCPACLLQFCLESEDSEADTEAPVKGTEDTGEPPLIIRDYQLLEEMGRGGMGIVFKALHLPLQRVVALKMLTPARLLSKKDVERFQTEAGAIAKLDHANILPVYDFGRKAARCYYTMRLAEGGNLAEAIARRQYARPETTLSRKWQEDIVRLVRTLAGAIEYAHKQGIIHRDLKPANILLDALGHPFVADFGLAKLSEGGADLTRTEAALGTPSYMAPEQAESGARSLTAKADIYGLGLILYELLTGRRAFDGKNPFEALRRIREEEPLAPRCIDSLIDNDLEIICLKCLEKDPKDRFGTAGELVRELDRWLRREPILSRRATAGERIVKWFRREPLVGSLVTGVLVTLIAGAAVSLRMAARARAAAIQAERMNTKFELQLAEDMLANGQAAVGVAYLADVVKREPANTPAAERLVSALSQRGFCVPVLSLGHAEMVKAVHFSPDGRRLASVAGENAYIWDAKTGQKTAGPMKNGGLIHEAAFSPDSKCLATAMKDGLDLWDTTSGARVRPYLCQAEISSVYFSPDGKSLLACGTASNAWLFDVASARQVCPPLNTAYVWRAAFSANGGLIALGCEDGTAAVWERATGRVRSRLRHGGPVYACDFSPNGDELLTAGGDGCPRVWNISTGTTLAPAVKSAGNILHSKFSPDGLKFATGGEDASAWLWDAKSCRQTAGPLKHLGTVFYVAFSPDGRLLLTCSVDKTARLWDTATGEPLAEPLQCRDEVRQAEFSRDGRWIVTRSLTTNAVVWLLKTRQNYDAQVSLPARTKGAAISRDRHYAAMVGYAGGLWIWDLLSHTLPRKVFETNIPLKQIVFVPGVDQIVGGSVDGEVSFWNAATGQFLRTARLHDGEISSIRFSQGGTRMITASADGTAKVWEYPSLQCVATLNHTNVVHYGGFGPIRDGDLSPDGKLAATASWDRSAWIWEASSGRLLHGPLRHDHTLQRVQFSPDGRTVTTYSQDQIKQSWDVQTGAPIGSSGTRQIGVTVASTGPDRTRIIATTHDQFAYMRDSQTGRLLTEPIRHDAAMDWVEISEDGILTLCGSADGVISLRNVPRILMPAPDWVGLFAEAMCGYQISESGAPELVKDRSAAIPEPTQPTMAESPWLSWRRRVVNLDATASAGGVKSYWPNTVSNWTY